MAKGHRDERHNHTRGDRKTIIAIGFDADTFKAVNVLSRTRAMKPDVRDGIAKPSFSRTVRVLVAEALAARATIKDGA